MVYALRFSSEAKRRNNEKISRHRIGERSQGFEPFLEGKSKESKQKTRLPLIVPVIETQPACSSSFETVAAERGIPFN